MTVLSKFSKCSSEIGEGLAVWGALPDQFKKESVRLASFFHSQPCWTISGDSFAEVASDGFFYTGMDRIVKCVFCDFVYNLPLLPDLHWVDHRLEKPDCPFVRGKGVGNVTHKPESLSSCEDDMRLKLLSEAFEDVVLTLTLDSDSESDSEEEMDDSNDAVDYPYHQFGRLSETPSPKDTLSPTPSESSSGFSYSSRPKFGQLPETPPPKDTPSPPMTETPTGLPCYLSSPCQSTSRGMISVDDNEKTVSLEGHYRAQETLRRSQLFRRMNVLEKSLIRLPSGNIQIRSRNHYRKSISTVRVIDQRVACLPRLFCYGYFPIDKLLSSGPFKPEKSEYFERIKSFLNWDFDKVVSSDQLAKAGFYYRGIYDIVHCFHCDGAIHNWRIGDDPFTLHAKCFPSCGFILKTKGQDFVASQSKSFTC